MRDPPSLGVQPERQWDNPDECFERFSIDLAARPGRMLETVDDIIETLCGPRRSWLRPSMKPPGTTCCWSIR